MEYLIVGSALSFKRFVKMSYNRVKEEIMRSKYGRKDKKGQGDGLRLLRNLRY